VIGEIIVGDFLLNKYRNKNLKYIMNWSIDAQEHRCTGTTTLILTDDACYINEFGKYNGNVNAVYVTSRKQAKRLEI
jgi:hypothetical protein